MSQPKPPKRLQNMRFRKIRLSDQSLIEILHLEKFGYGPNGSMTRGTWRAVCLEKLTAGKDQFEAWQNQIVATHTNKSETSFGLKLNRAEKFNNLWQQSDACTLDFAGHVFTDLLDVKEFEFKLPSIFSHANLVNSSFENAIFNKRVDFNFTNFHGHYVNFRKAIFKAFVDFKGAEFPSNFMSFNRIGFEETEFHQYVDFENKVFRVKISFSGAKFYSGANFKFCKFEDLCNFEEAQFVISAQVNGWGKIDFQGVSFKNDAKFTKAEFGRSTNFSEAEFFGDAEFNSSKFYEDVRFFGVKFKGGVFYDESVFSGNAVKRLGPMKQLMEDNGATDQALNFNALELRAKRLLPNTDWGFKTVTLLYEVISDFGRSYIRPLVLYVLLIWLSFLYSHGHLYNKTEKTIFNAEWCVKDQNKLNLSVEQAAFEYAIFGAGGLMNFTDAGKQNNSVNCKLFGEPIEPPLMRAWGVFKGIASIALLFLAALGLRNKYRIK